MTLGNGWFSAGSSNHTSPYASTMPGARPVPPQLLLRARATVGAKRVLLVSSATSGQWQAASGPIVLDSLYQGEQYDARLELVDRAGHHFSHPQYDTSSATQVAGTALWAPAVKGDWMPRAIKLVPQIMPPIRTIRRLRAISVSSPSDGIWVVDFGQNSAAIVRMTIPRGLSAGSRITIMHGETLLSDSSALEGRSPLFSTNSSGRVYQGNLRTAKATDVYISSGKEPAGAQWEPAFTQHGFRFIEVHGLQTKPSLDDFEMWEMHTAVTESGHFHCSSTLLNRIQSNCAWTARSNMMSLPTDCCQRNERRGWMGDAALGASVNAYNSDSHAFYSSFADLMADDQGKPEDGADEGAMPNWVPIFPPTKRHSTKTSTGFPGAGAPNWMTAFPTILHTVWKHSGDTRLVKAHWPALVSYISWYDRKFSAFPDFSANPFRRTVSGNLSATQFPGDWCPPPAKFGSYYDGNLTQYADIKSGLGEAECGHTGEYDARLFTPRPYSASPSTHRCTGEYDAGGVSGRGGVGHAGGTWGRRLAA
eukprot:COSAG01_NODE_8293_length_2840_cov_14.414447_1_plen_535_part_00